MSSPTPHASATHLQTHMQARAEQVSNRLKLLANPNRLMIVCRLLDEELSVGDIEAELGIRQPTLSRELGRLRDEGVITGRRQSKIVFYSLTDPDMKALIQAVCRVTLGHTPTHSHASSAETTHLGTTDSGTTSPDLAPSFLARPKFTHTHIANSEINE